PQQGQFAASIQWILKGDAGLRALIAWHMSWEPARAVSGTDWMAPYLGTLLDDPYKAVRFCAERTLRALPGFEGLSYDFLAPESERRAAREWAEPRWSALGPPPDAAAVLVEHGALREGEFSRLLGLRDQKDMSLSE